MGDNHGYSFSLMSLQSANRVSSQRQFETPLMFRHFRCAWGVNLPRSVATDLLPSTFSVWRTYIDKFMSYFSFIQAQKVEWHSYFSWLIRSGALNDRTVGIGKRVSMLGSRVSLFLGDENKRHLWRSLQRDALTGRTTCTAVLTVEISPKNVSCSETSTNIFPVVEKALPNALRHQVPLLYYGYPGILDARPRRIPQTSMNHARMSLVAGATHLASLGVVEFPLFGLSIDGSIGTVICAWCGALKVKGNMQSVSYLF